jgi:hypothetical protein
VRALAVGAAPNAPNSTLVSERFIARHISWLRMIPDDPTSAPEMMSTVLLMTKPVIAAAIPEYELSSEITTGMSAPPMGSTSPTPSASASAVPIQNTSGSGSGVATCHTPTARIAAKISPLTTCCPRYVTGRPVISSCSLANATTLPVSVTAPMSVPSWMATPVGTASRSRRAAARSSSAPLTSSDAAPPSPLSSATICGMAVIFTARAIHSPSAVPTTMPAAITVYDTIARSASVTSTATSIPIPDRRLPARAVSVRPSRLRPRTKRTAASR